MHSSPDRTHARSTTGARLRGLLATLALTGLVALGAVMLLPPFFGLERFVIVGSSMSGTIDRGSIVYDDVVPTAALRVGDVITYRPPPGARVQELVTHRIVWAGKDGHAARAFRTKGDANRTADPWRFTLDRRTQARVAFHIPYLGYVLSALSIRWLRMIVIGGPALVIALASLAGLRRETETQRGAAA